MHTDRPDLGTASWVQLTSGHLDAGERRALLRALARAHLTNLRGRLVLAVGLEPGRRAYLDPVRLRAPASILTRAARERAEAMLSPTLLNHSHRTYRFGRALGELDGLDVDDELLFAGAMLHDTGLVDPRGRADFTLASVRVAREVAEAVGLSAPATEILLTAIALHHSPGVDLRHGAEAFLLSAGAAVDVVGMRSWDLPRGSLADAVALHPRLGFKTAFINAFRQEATRVPRGRVQLLQRYGAFSAAIRLAPFAE